MEDWCWLHHIDQAAEAEAVDNMNRIADFWNGKLPAGTFNKSTRGIHNDKFISAFGESMLAGFPNHKFTFSTPTTKQIRGNASIRDHRRREAVRPRRIPRRKDIGAARDLGRAGHQGGAIGYVI
jgi:hypothetical protein